MVSIVVNYLEDRGRERELTNCKYQVRLVYVGSTATNHSVICQCVGTTVSRALGPTESVDQTNHRLDILISPLLPYHWSPQYAGIVLNFVFVL